VKPLQLGRTLATPAALAVLEEAGIDPASLLFRHQYGDDGDDLSAADRAANLMAHYSGARVLSAYNVNGVRLYVISEAVGDDGHRACTTILRSDEY